MHFAAAVENNVFLAGGIGKEREEYKERLGSLGLGLEDRMTSKVGLLSGGQRQAVTLLMASLRKPSCYF